MLQVNFFRRTPGGMGGFEEVLRPDDFAFKEGRQGGMVVREP